MRSFLAVLVLLIVALILIQAKDENLLNKGQVRYPSIPKTETIITPPYQVSSKDGKYIISQDGKTLYGSSGRVDLTSMEKNIKDKLENIGCGRWERVVSTPSFSSKLGCESLVYVCSSSSSSSASSSSVFSQSSRVMISCLDSNTTFFSSLLKVRTDPIMFEEQVVIGSEKGLHLFGMTEQTLEGEVLAITKDSSYLYTVNSTKLTKLSLDQEKIRVIWSISIPDQYCPESSFGKCQLAVDPDRSKIYLFGTQLSSVAVYNTISSSMVTVITLPSPPLGDFVEISSKSGNNNILFTTQDGVASISTERDNFLWSHGTSSKPLHLASDSQNLVLVRCKTGEILVLNGTTGGLVWKYTFVEAMNKLNFRTTDVYLKNNEQILLTSNGVLGVFSQRNIFLPLFPALTKFDKLVDLILDNDQIRPNSNNVSDLSSISPKWGSTDGGRVVTIYGQGFNQICTASVPCFCLFNDTQVPVTNISDTKIICHEAPKYGHGPINLTLSHTNDTDNTIYLAVSSNATFTYEKMPTVYAGLVVVILFAIGCPVSVIASLVYTLRLRNKQIL